MIRTRVISILHLAGLLCAGLAAAPGSAWAQTDFNTVSKVCPQDDQSGGVALSAIMVDGARPIRDPIKWTISAMDGSCSGLDVARVIKANPTVALAPGRYRLTARYEQAVAGDTLTVSAGPAQKHQVNMNAALINFRLVLTPGSPMVTTPLKWELFEYAKTPAGHGSELSTQTAPEVRFIVNAGSYVVRATYDVASADIVVPLLAGQTFDYTLDLYAGTLHLDAREKGGGAVTGPVSYEIQRAEADASGKHETIATVTSPGHPLTLREGNYLVLARSGSRSGQAPVSVKAGKAKSLSVTLSGG
jgi:hypothetical protein